MANELHKMYEDAGSPEFSRLVASGNGVRKNEALRIVLSEVFGMELTVPDIKEEAAYGAAKFAKNAVKG
jgi:sedoheptulokinase